MIDELKGLLGLWGILGYFVVVTLPTPRNKLDATFQLFIGGPICWTVMIPISITYLILNRFLNKGERNDF